MRAIPYGCKLTTKQTWWLPFKRAHYQPPHSIVCRRCYTRSLASHAECEVDRAVNIGFSRTKKRLLPRFLRILDCRKPQARGGTLGAGSGQALGEACPSSLTMPLRGDSDCDDRHIFALCRGHAVPSTNCDVNCWAAMACPPGPLPRRKSALLSRTRQTRLATCRKNREIRT
jgi:hypothetical protein